MNAADDEILSAVFKAGALGQSYGQIATALGVTRSVVGGMIKRVRDAAPQVVAAGLSDIEVKRILDRLLVDGASAEAVAKDFARAANRRGEPAPLTASAVRFVVAWVLHDLAAAGDDVTLRPGNGDVVAWPSWWRPVQGAAGVAA